MIESILKPVCRDFARSSKIEWLETNGTGAFAMGTVAGVNTRRYHALLTVSLKPPVERYVLLSHVEEEIEVDGNYHALGVAQYPGSVSPKGYELLEGFCSEPCATWSYQAGSAKIEKQVYLVEGRQAVVIRYRADQAVTARVRPFLAYRDYHALASGNSDLNPSVSQSTGSIRMQPYPGLPPMEFRFDGEFTREPHWYLQTEYLEELSRGLEYCEDLFTPGVLKMDLPPGQWVSICASIDGTEASDPPVAKRDPFIVRRSDGRSTIIAGYPWFTDWGRDTMIALPGLLVAKGRFAEARDILQGFLEFLNNGLLPNRFPDAGHLPEYNTADDTLWMFQAVREYVAASGDQDFLREVFYRDGQQIIDWHMRGTSYAIRVDHTDHLLRAGTPGTQLTWMDAKVGEWVVTPRDGKPVEINALWHSALRLMGEWGFLLKDARAEQYVEAADKVRVSFREKFWNPTRACLYDVLTDAGPVTTLRPNQIFAVSLPHTLLEPEQQQAVVRIVEHELLTPVGLRTLERSDPDYRPRYQGTPWERDGAYHRGTVWPWLMGPFVDAYLNAFGRAPENLRYCRRLLDDLEAHAARDTATGAIAEIYDAEEPRLPRGCPAQAWSGAEIARVRKKYGF